MKKLYRLCAAALMAFAAFGATAQEQQMPQVHPLELDKEVVTGTLPNGITYYIRHNETPKGQADFYIAQKVGSILEEDNQRGLAHFLEHMCFNGTENFPGKGIINWLESVGVKFGRNLNAYTSIDETVYNISSVPVARQSVQDSCLLILHDWANALTLDPAEIDAERGVIHEEWRRSMAGQMRILENLLPVMYPGNKYGYRLPIGTMEVVDNFPPQALRDYYHTWYRPDQQGIIVVGDIDPAYIESKIKEIFSPIKMPENARERTYLGVEDNPGTIYAIGSDPEQTMGLASMMFKFDPMPREIRNSIEYLTTDYMMDVVSKMLSNRLDEIASKPDAPFAHASFSIDDYMISKTKSAASLDVVAKGDDVLPGLEAAYRELLRAVRGGFTAGEYERASAEIRSELQKKYDQRANTPNDDYSKAIVRTFVDNVPMPGIDIEKQIIDLTSQAIPVEQINTILPQLIEADNRVLLAALPGNGTFRIPTEAETAAVLTKVDAEDIEPYRDEMRTDPLIPSLPVAGTIASQTRIDDIDATEYTLSNGIKVVVKPTRFKDGEIQFAASARGGISTEGDDQAANIIFFDYASDSRGLGTYTASDLKKYLQGKQLELIVDFSPYDRSVTGNTTVADLPTFMELLHATFTEYTFNPDDFAATQNMIMGFLANKESTPEFVFQKALFDNIYKAPARHIISTEIIKQADAAGSQALVRRMLANPADFTFYFVGDIDMATFGPLMEKYLANLPTGGASVELKLDPAFEPALGRATAQSTMAMQTPQTWVYYYISDPVEYTAKNRAIGNVAAQIMSKRLLDKVREEMGATYSIGSYGTTQRLATNNYAVQIPFPMKPEMKDQALAAIDVIIKEMARNVTEAELAPVKEFMIKDAREKLEQNKDWAQSLSAISLNGVQTFTDAEAIAASITVADVMDFWKRVLQGDNIRLILIDPAQ
ncbi:MAG: insulinase family protein [Bacteroides sp.]|nr:insulinase family protein [Bacteroides sp.]MCM1095920.1 insulinase family protein [Terasakiella sp.]